MSRTTARLGAVTAAGVLLLAAGLFVATRPDTVTAEFPRLVALGERVDPGRALLALIGTLLVLVPLLVALGRYRRESAGALAPRAREDGTGADGERGERPVVGSDLEAAIERATDYEGTGASARASARETVLDRLRPAAADAYARREGLGEAAAREAVERGEWTGDRRAAAFLGEGALPLSVWLYDLCTAEDPYRRSLAHAVGAIEAVQTEPGAFGTAELEDDREDEEVPA